MKKILWCLFWECLVCGVQAQTPDLKVAASAGASYRVQNFQLDWTLGEPVILTFERPSILLSQGFHQPTYDWNSPIGPPKWDVYFKVFPSPFSEVVYVELEFDVAESGYLELIDIIGRTIWKEAFNEKIFTKEYATHGLAAGVYVMNLVLPNKKENQHISIVKI